MKFYERKRSTLKKQPDRARRAEGNSELFIEFMYGKDRVKELRKYGDFK